jgi:hypothetical protein
MARPRLVVPVVLALILVAVPAAGAHDAALPSLSTLLTRHAPILVLHPAEPVRPVAVDGFLADSDLQRRTGPGAWETIPRPLPRGGADLRLDQRLCRAIEGSAATSCYAAAEAAHGSEPVVYGAAFRRGNRIALQYWLWYPWNVYSPTVPAGDLWQVHEGDWESVSVILDRTGKPLVVGLSSHCDGTRREWSKAPKRGTHPVAYVGVGSHANFFAVGEHRLDPACWTRQVIAIIKAYGLKPVDRTGNGRALRPKLLRVTAMAPRWMGFAGRWGEDAYIHFPNNSPQLYGPGPPGPAYHEQWRNPVADVLGWPRG